MPGRCTTGIVACAQSCHAGNENLFCEPPGPVRIPASGNSPRVMLAKAGNLVFKGMRAIYRRLPVSRHLKHKISTWLYTHKNGLTRKRERDELEGGAENRLDWSTSIGRIDKDVSLKTMDLDFQIHEHPDVSVIVAVYNKWDYTLACLRSIITSKPKTSFEIIVVDDGSTDETPEALKLVKGIKVITKNENQGFLLACNTAAREARGNFLHFLNNDVQVLPGWLDELYQTFTEIPEAGLVGSKLVYPDGKLQEAGGVIWNDGSGTNFGRGDDPNKPEYNFVRDADYCSGASIMVPAKIFRRLEGFDERFVPAYYEDTDLAFSVRKLGLRVIYQPFSRVVHFEGVTAGTDISTGTKSCQAINQSIFLEKWKRELAIHHSSGLSGRLGSGRKIKRALLIDFETPKPDTDSASMDTVYYLKMLQSLGYRVSFIANDLKHSRQYTENLQRLGVECLYKPYAVSVGDYLREKGALYQLVFMQKVHYVKEYFEQARKFCVNAKLIFNTVDLHYVREQRYAELEDSDLLRSGALDTRSIELGIMRKSDATIVISQEEKHIVEREAPDVNVFCIPYVRETRPSKNDFAARKDIVFIGGFNHLPNIDAVKYFVKEVFPRVREKLPDVIFRIVGSNIPGMVFKEEEVNELAGAPGVEIAGFADELDSIFNQCRISVAPLRFGAGIKGKIGTSLCYGVPCVATPIAVEGMDLENGKNILLGSNADDFAEQVVSLYTDEESWKRISSAGIVFMKEHYSFEKGLERLRGMIETIC